MPISTTPSLVSRPVFAGVVIVKVFLLENMFLHEIRISNGNIFITRTDCLSNKGSSVLLTVIVKILESRNFVNVIYNGILLRHSTYAKLTTATDKNSALLWKISFS